MKIKWNDESASILLSALMFLIVVSVLFTGLGNIIQNEARQMQLLKDSYIAKVMIQKAHLISKENNDVLKKDNNNVTDERTITFNHGIVTVSVQSEDRIRYIAKLNNAFIFEQEFKLIFLPDEEVMNNELITEEDNSEDKVTVDKENPNQEEFDNDMYNEDENNFNNSTNTFSEEVEVNNGDEEEIEE